MVVEIYNNNLLVEFILQNCFQPMSHVDLTFAISDFE